MATIYGSRLKLVPEEFKNYFIAQDEEYFSSQETDDIFVSGKFRKKKRNRIERRVCPEHRVMEYNYICIWHY